MCRSRGLQRLKPARGLATTCRCLALPVRRRITRQHRGICGVRLRLVRVAASAIAPEVPNTFRAVS